ncbi:MAG: hypothetical protein LRZ85_08855 [Alphaproteobacteria bacterium]|nr:hypothetical protein [Alphaproteobacteria bacterium]
MQNMKNILLIAAIISLAALGCYFLLTQPVNIAKEKAEYEARLILPHTECNDVPLNGEDYLSETGDGNVVKDRRGQPINVAGLICGGASRDCKIADRCGDLVGFVCGRGRPYFIARLSTKEIVSKCPNQKTGCLDLVPSEWTCPSPQNMPLSKADQEKYPKYKGAISCGDLLGVGSGMSDGPYYFINKRNGKTIGECGFWKSVAEQKPCSPPPEWYCGFPTNYH